MRNILGNRLYKTHSQRFLSLSLFVFIPLSTLWLIALIVIGMFQDSFREGMYLAWISIPICGMILMAVLLAIIPLIISPIDRKKYGKGIYTVEFECDFTEKKRFDVVNLLSGLGFILNEQKEILYFTKSLAINNVSSCCHITLSYRDAKLEIAAYLSSVNLVAGDFIGLYGYGKIMLKNNCRKIVAAVLNALEAPAEIMV